jgi:hypothetical protein
VSGVLGGGEGGGVTTGADATGAGDDAADAGGWGAGVDTASSDGESLPPQLLAASAAQKTSAAKPRLRAVMSESPPEISCALLLVAKQSHALHADRCSAGTLIQVVSPVARAARERRRTACSNPRASGGSKSGY